jgi:hypothetical protein
MYVARVNEQPTGPPPSGVWVDGMWTEKKFLHPISFSQITIVISYVLTMHMYFTYLVATKFRTFPTYGLTTYIPVSTFL